MRYFLPASVKEGNVIVALRFLCSWEDRGPAATDPRIGFAGEALAELPPRMQSVLIEHYVLGKTPAEIFGTDRDALFSGSDLLEWAVRDFMHRFRMKGGFRRSAPPRRRSYRPRQYIPNEWKLLESTLSRGPIPRTLNEAFQWLEVSPWASQSFMRMAYDAKMSLYNPDLIARWKPSLRENAEQMIKGFNAAWEIVNASIAKQP